MNTKVNSDFTKKRSILTASWSVPQNLDSYFEMQIMFYSYQFRLKKNFRLGKKSFIFHRWWTWLTEKLLPITLQHARSFHW